MMLVGTWAINWNDSNTMSHSLMFMSRTRDQDIATCTTDGNFLYIHDTCGLVKIGTGNNGTKRYVNSMIHANTMSREINTHTHTHTHTHTYSGRVIAIKPDWEPKTKGWLVHIKGRLYYRSPSIEPASLVVLDATTLSVCHHYYKAH
jgi:hypothetical protein